MNSRQRKAAGRLAVRVALAGILIAGLSFTIRSASADGALAVGLPENVAKTGFAFGWSTNRATGPDARMAALDFCQKAKDASPAARKLCRVFGSFKDQCVAVAMDPKDGTPGVGWAMATEKEWAETEALNACRETAGPGREGECKLSASACDGR